MHSVKAKRSALATFFSSLFSQRLATKPMFKCVHLTRLMLFGLQAVQGLSFIQLNGFQSFRLDLYCC